MPPQAVLALMATAVTMRKTIHPEAQEGTRSAPTLRPQGVAPAVSLPMVRAGTNQMARQVASRMVRRTARQTVTRFLLRLRLRADLLIHSAYARLSYKPSQDPTSLGPGRCMQSD